MPRFLLTKLAPADPSPAEVPGSITVLNLRLLPDPAVTLEKYYQALQNTPGAVPAILLPFVQLLAEPPSP